MGRMKWSKAIDTLMALRLAGISNEYTRSLEDTCDYWRDYYYPPSIKDFIPRVSNITTS